MPGPSLTGGSFLDKLLAGIKYVLNNGAEVVFRPSLNFIGFTILDNPALGTTNIYAPSTGGSGGSGGGSVIVEVNGSPLPNEPAINFVGFTVANNPGNSSNDVFPSGAAPVVVTSTHTVQPGETWFLVAPGATITMGASPVAGVSLLFTPTGDVSGLGDEITFLGNGKNIADPLARFTFASSSVLTIPGVSVTYRYDGTKYQCVEAS